MIEKPDEPSLFIAVIYALSAITGGLGGCAVWAFSISRAKKRTVFLMAYLILGFISGLAVAAVFGIVRQWTLHQVILYSLLSGIVVTIVAFGINFGAGVTLRYKNFEAKFTLRQPNEDRRKNGDHDTE